MHEVSTPHDSIHHPAIIPRCILQVPQSAVETWFNTPSSQIPPFKRLSLLNKVDNFSLAFTVMQLQAACSCWVGTLQRVGSTLMLAKECTLHSTAKLTEWTMTAHSFGFAHYPTAKLTACHLYFCLGGSSELWNIRSSTAPMCANCR